MEAEKAIAESQAALLALRESKESEAIEQNKILSEICRNQKTNNSENRQLIKIISAKNNDKNQNPNLSFVLRTAEFFSKLS